MEANIFLWETQFPLTQHCNFFFLFLIKHRKLRMKKNEEKQLEASTPHLKRQQKEGKSVKSHSKESLKMSRSQLQYTN